MKNKESILANLEAISNLIEYYMRALNGKQISAEDMVVGLDNLKKKIDYVSEMIEVE